MLDNTDRDGRTTSGNRSTAIATARSQKERRESGGEVVPTLESHLNGPVPTRWFLEVASAVAAALHELHEGGVLHRDLQPQNIRFDGNRATLTGLEFSSDPTSPNEALPRGRTSLPYMAPEQTGRMNRSIDARSDLYSLGVIFYRMLTGVLPLDADEPLDWVYAHIARRPAHPSEHVTTIPSILSDLVLRLLAKNAEERYQSAAGVEADLRRAWAALGADGNIERFALGSEDFPAGWRVPEKLYSRARERRALVDALDRMVSTGRSELALVAGPAGIGKSALVRELTRESSFRSVLFVAGKADQARRDVPLATIGMAFGRLVRSILRRSEAEVAAWTRAIATAMGRNGQVMTDIVPELKWLLGDQPSLPALGPTEARNRFLTVFGDFIAAVATTEHPLVIVIDDLQWIDLASLGLLEYLSTRSDLPHVLAIGSYRTEEVGAEHPVRLGVERIRRAGAPILEVEVAPLAAGDVLRLVADATRCAESEVSRLSELVHAKTGGNPLFVHQFLASIAEDGLLVFDRSSRRWVADIDAITVLDVTDNVVDLMVVKLRRLPAVALEKIKRLACLGHEAGLQTLASINGGNERATLTALEEALAAGLLTLHDDTVRFAHDRIQEAAYSLIPPADRPRWHLEIGRKLLGSLPAEELDKWIFAIVDHFDQGAVLIEQESERSELGRLHARAGYRARSAVAFVAARKHFARACELLSADAWSDAYRPTLDLHLALQECEFVAGATGRASELFETMRAHAASELHHAEILHRWMLLHQGVGRVEEALAFGLEALALLGVVLPTQREAIHDAYRAEQRRVHQQLAKRSIADLEQLPVATDARARAIMGLFAVVGACAYNAHQALAPLIYCRALMTALEWGNTPASCMTYISFGSALVSRGDVDSGLAFADLALRLNEKFEDIERRGMLLYVQGAHVNPFRRHMTTSLPYFEAGMRACQEVGDFVFANYHASAIATITIESGRALDEVLEITGRYADFSRETRNEPVRQWILAARQLARCLRGATSALGSLEDQNFSEDRSLEIMGRARFYTGVANLHLTRLEALVFAHRWEEALVAADRCAATVNALRSGPREVTFHYCHALVLCSLHPLADEARRPAIEETLVKAVERLAFWARNCPRSYGHRHKLLLAEIAGIRGHDLVAMQHYDEAIQSAAENGFAQNEGLANELAARFYHRRGLERNAGACRAGARSADGRWGADALVARLDRDHRPASDDVEFGTAGTRIEDLDLASILEASQAVSNEIVLDRLVERLLRLALEDAGADRGLLMLTGDVPQIVAEATARLQSVQVNHQRYEASAAGLSQSVLGYVLRTTEHVMIDDTGGEHPYRDDAYLQGEKRPRSLLCLPLLKQASLVGVLYLENHLTPGAFTPDRTALLEILASQAAISLQNATLFEDVQRERASIRELNETLEQRVAERTADLDRAMAEQQQILEQLARKTRDLEQARDQLARLAFVDGLTGVANRRGFDDALDQEWRRAARAGTWLSVILIDLDWFKAINDRYGHARGDECLQAVAETLSAIAHRPADLVARYGGEELVILLPATGPGGVRKLMEQVLVEIRALEIPNAGSPIGFLTASAGAFSLKTADHGDDAQAAMAQADQALYASKAAGRNQGRQVVLERHSS
ncbi:MAG: diguanylate cyclase [Pseudomonadota bacterium]